MKTMILDIAKWRCGGDGIHRNGNGLTLLLNDEGFMCCIGQFCEQNGYTKSELLGVGEPKHLASIKDEIDFLVTQDYLIHNTILSNYLLKINDDVETTISEKIRRIRKLLKEQNILLKVINYKKLKRK